MQFLISRPTQARNPAVRKQSGARSTPRPTARTAPFAARTLLVESDHNQAGTLAARVSLNAACRFGGCTGWASSSTNQSWPAGSEGSDVGRPRNVSWGPKSSCGGCVTGGAGGEVKVVVGCGRRAMRCLHSARARRQPRQPCCTRNPSTRTSGSRSPRRERRLWKVEKRALVWGIG
jgi:hypothetical protein